MAASCTRILSEALYTMHSRDYTPRRMIYEQLKHAIGHTRQFDTIDHELWQELNNALDSVLSADMQPTPTRAEQRLAIAIVDTIQSVIEEDGLFFTHEEHAAVRYVPKAPLDPINDPDGDDAQTEAHRDG